MKKTSDNSRFSPLSAMQRICSVREYCEHDIRLKLKKYDIGEDEIALAISKLKEDKFLDEARFAAAFVRDKSRLSSWGKRKIVFALKSKMVPEDVITSALSEIDKDNERKTLEKIISAKAKEMRNTEERNKKMAKLIRFGLSRGFDYDCILEVVNKIIG